VDSYDAIVVEKLNIPEMVNRQHKVRKMGLLHGERYVETFTMLRGETSSESSNTRRKVLVGSHQGRSQEHDPSVQPLRRTRLRRPECQDTSMPVLWLRDGQGRERPMNILQKGLAIIRACSLPQPAEKDVSTVHRRRAPFNETGNHSPLGRGSSPRSIQKLWENFSLYSTHPFSRCRCCDKR